MKQIIPPNNGEPKPTIKPNTIPNGKKQKAISSFLLLKLIISVPKIWAISINNKNIKLAADQE